jgi:hypothetical protein
MVSGKKKVEWVKWMFVQVGILNGKTALEVETQVEARNGSEKWEMATGKGCRK